MDKMDSNNSNPLDSMLGESTLPEKEQRILESAIQVFSEKGFSAATTSEIAKGAGVAEGTIFRYFKTKKDILRGILIQSIKLISGGIVMKPVEKILLNTEGKDLRQIIRDLLYDRMKLVDKMYPMMQVVLSECLYHQDVREAVFQHIILKASETFEIFHRDMVNRGLMRGDVDTETLIRSVVANMAFFIGQRKMFPEKFQGENLEKELDRMVDVLLYGIAQPRSINGKE